MQQIGADILIAKSHHAQTHLLQHRIAPGIAFALLRSPVYPAIQLDHQAGFVAIEIHDETGDDLLAPAMGAEPIGAQLLR